MEENKVGWVKHWERFLKSGDPSICISDIQADWIKGFISELIMEERLEEAEVQYGRGRELGRRERNEDVIEKIDNCVAIQKQNLNDEYMRGMANGLIVAHSVVSGEEPVFVEPMTFEDDMYHSKGRKCCYLNPCGCVCHVKKLATQPSSTPPESVKGDKS